MDIYYASSLKQWSASPVVDIRFTYAHYPYRVKLKTIKLVPVFVASLLTTMAKRKWTNNDLQNTMQKTEDCGICCFSAKHTSLSTKSKD